MTAADSGGGGTSRSRFSKAMRSLFMKQATIADVENVAPGFRLVAFEGPALRHAGWIPGQKLQIAMGGAFATRTYTPIEWDAATGRTQILGYMHGDAPGSAWLRRLKVGDACEAFGPRGSTDARGLDGPLAVFGDETSIGLAAALARQDRDRAVTNWFEVSDRTSAEQVIAALDIGTATLFERQADDAHLPQLEAALADRIDAGGSFVLTGKAGTVQRLRHALKQRGVPASRIATKAYWAPGKIGLD